MDTGKGLKRPVKIKTRDLKHIRMPKEVEAELKAYAAAEGITFNAAVVLHLQKGLAR